MTVVAWDGTTLAADKMCSHGDLASTICEVRKVDGHLVGGAGGSVAVEEFFSWFRDGRVAEKWPKSQEDKDEWAVMLVVTPDRRVLRYERYPTPYEIFSLPVAIGAGREVAIGAMLMGADAVKAVEITSLVIHCVGRGVDALTLEGET